MPERFLDRFNPPPAEGYGWTTKVIGTNGVEYEMRNQTLPQRADGRGKYHIEFEYQFNIVNDTNRGVVKIHNLRPQDIKDFEKGKLMVIKAGWLPDQGDSLLTLNVTVDEVGKTLVGTTGMTMDIWFSDSPEVYLTHMTNRHFKPGVKASTCFKTIVGDMGFSFSDAPQFMIDIAKAELQSLGGQLVAMNPKTAAVVDKLFSLKYFKPAEDPVYKKRGKTFYRPAWMALDELALDMNSKFYVNNRGVYLLPKDEGFQVDVLLDDGAKGFPIITRGQTTHSETDDFFKNDYEDFEPGNVILETYLHPLIVPDAIIGVKQQELGGLYRVVAGSHYNSGDEVFTQVILKPIIGGPTAFVDEGDKKAVDDKAEALKEGGPGPADTPTDAPPQEATI